MKTKIPDSIKNPVVKIDKSLDKHTGVPLFQKKVEEAKKTLKRVGIPEELKPRRSSE